MTIRLLLSVICLGLITACECDPSKPDGSVQDAGIDAGHVWEDGGRIDVVGGCYREPHGEKFIMFFETEDPLCAAVSFRRFDGSFEPLFGGGPWPQQYVLYNDGGVWPSEPWTDYEIDDARVGLCSMPFEQSDGQLNQAGARLEDFRAAVTIHYQAGRAQAYNVEGSLAFFGRRYWFSTGSDLAGLIEVCGP